MQKSAFTRAAHTRTVKLFFSTTTPTTSLWDSPWPAAPGLKAPASLPPGVNRIPFRKNFLVATAESASGYFSGESMVAESSQGTGFLLEGPSARSATNHQYPRGFPRTLPVVPTLLRSNSAQPPKRSHAPFGSRQLAPFAPLSSFGPGGGADTKNDQTDT